MILAHLNQEWYWYATTLLSRDTLQKEFISDFYIKNEPAV